MIKENKDILFKNFIFYNFLIYIVATIFTIYLIKVDLSLDNKYINALLIPVLFIYLIKLIYNLYNLVLSFRNRYLYYKSKKGVFFNFLGLLILPFFAFLTNKADDSSVLFAFIAFVPILKFIFELKTIFLNIKNNYKYCFIRKDDNHLFGNFLSKNRLKIVISGSETDDIYIDGRIKIKGSLNHVRPNLKNKGSVGRNEILYDFYFDDKKFNMNDILSYIENSDKKFNDLDENDISVIEMISIR